MKSGSLVDWVRLQDHLREMATLDPESSLPVTPDTKRFVRLQRFIMRCSRVPDPNKARDAMIELAKDHSFTVLQAGRLYVRLQHLASRYRFKNRLEGYERAGNATKHLQEIHFALTRIASFSKGLLSDNANPRDRIVEKRLENEAHFWADRRKRSDRWEEAAALGFNHRIYDSSGVSYNSYDSLIVLRTWLRGNVLFSELAANVIAKSYDAVSTDETEQPQQVTLSAIEELAGIRLPKLYKRFTGERFGFSRTESGKLAYTRGPKFVTMCLPVMGMERLSLETLRSHWKAGKASGYHEAS
jgi:hypothetical protein